ncbi:MAG: 16S rRNA (adenine(1518)-N(6)/adenine(1519)-N(6))-dimethyltransferase RsmA [Pseudomonadota bacterium]
MSDDPPLRDVIERYGLAAKKTLGQHFLLDLNITRKIVRLAEIDDGDHVIEIGPGPGGLTRALLETGARVTAIERDERCIAALEELSAANKNRCRVIEADALSVDETGLLDDAEAVKIVSNLPYNISTELLIKWLRAGPPLWRSMTLMFQKEVADRILADPGNKTYGRLSVIAQAASKPRRAFDLPARAFSPPPKVDSTVVIFDPPTDLIAPLNVLERVTQAAFSQRRKMLRVSLRPLFHEQLSAALENANATETQRAEELSVEQFQRLALAL